MAEFLCPYDAWEPWCTPDVVLSSGPDSAVIGEPDVLALLDGMQPASGRVGFTVNPGPAH